MTAAYTPTPHADHYVGAHSVRVPRSGDGRIVTWCFTLGARPKMARYPANESQLGRTQ